MAKELSGRVAWALNRAIKKSAGKGAKREGAATFVRRDPDGTCWVKLPGADAETPVNGSSLANAQPGQMVAYRIDGTQLSIIGNASEPSVGQASVDRTVEPVERKADSALAEASRAHAAADAAEADAARAQAAADDAQDSADAAATAAGDAQSSADDAATAAAAAQADASQALEDAAAAASAASDAQTSADAAATAASVADGKAVAAAQAASAAQGSADAAALAASVADGKAVAAGQAASAAQSSADSANRSANSALTQLSFVEDVAGTLDWIQSHGSFVATSDTSVTEGKVYFELKQGDYVPIASPDPDADPSEEGWYELDTMTAQSDYIMSHLAVTSAGLWVLPSGIGSAQTPAQASGWKMLLANDRAVIYDGSGTAVTTLGESIAFDAGRPQRIGNSTAYVEFSPTGGGTVSIVGSNLNQSVSALEATTATVANPNLYPFFSMPMTGCSEVTTTSELNDVANNTDDYWCALNYGSYGHVLDCVEVLSDGWAHIEYDNSEGSSLSGVGYLYVRDTIGLEANHTYTAMVEFRNVAATGSDPGWTLSSASGQISGNNGGFLFVSGDIEVTGGSAVAYRQVVANRHGLSKWAVALSLGVKAGTSVSLDFRVSFYDGTYSGPYKPYVGTDYLVRMSNAESSITQNATAIETKVSQTDFNALSGRVDSAETTITQHTDAIALRATKTEAAQMAQPNLYPFFSIPLSDCTDEPTDESGYWHKITSSQYVIDGYIETLSDGWARFNVDNTEGSAGIYAGVLMCRDVFGIQPDTEYTGLFEFRNVVESVAKWTLTTVGTGYTQMGTGSGTSGSGLHINRASHPDAFVDGKAVIRTTVRANTYGADKKWLCALYLGVGAGRSVSFDVRISIYDGTYEGPYKPYVGKSLYASQAELKVAYDEIDMKVDTNGVIAAINLSTETEGGSAATIHADKVNIEGAAIFTGNGRLSQTSLDGAYDAYGAADGVVVGGRNLLRYTAHPEVGQWLAYGGNNTYARTSDGIKITITGSGNHGHSIPLAYDGCVTDNEEYVLSFDYRTNFSTTGYIYILCRTSPNAELEPVAVNGDGEWHHFSERLTWTTIGDRVAYRLLIGYINGSGNWFEIRDSSIKLERGNKETDWTPAPEDATSEGTEYIVGTQSAATNAWTGATSDTALVAGKAIAYKLPYAGNSSAATLNLTLAGGGTTGAKAIRQVYKDKSTTGAIATVTNQWPAGAVIPMVWDPAANSGNGWWVVQNLNTSQETQAYNVNYRNTIVAGEKLRVSSIIGGRSDGKYYEVGASRALDLSYPILWATKEIAANGTNYDAIWTQIIDRSFAVLYDDVITGTKNAVVYLVGTVSGNTFTTLASGYLTCTEPTTEDGRFYIPIGRIGNNSNNTNTNNYFNFCVNTPVTLYAYLDGKFRQVTPTEIVATHRIYHRDQTAQANLAAPTTWVAEATGNTYGAWTTKVPPYAASTAEGQTKYPFLYTCEQRKRLDGTIECTKVLLDENTTVIDGGNIITHSITADEIDANSVKANIVQTTDLSADKITSGNITADRMKTNIVSAVQAVVTDLYALVAKIGGFIVDATSIRTAALTSNADNSIGLSTADFTRTVNGTSRAGLRFAMGDKFGVTGDGVLYADGANITNISASSVTIGGSTSLDTKLSNQDTAITNAAKRTDVAIAVTAIDYTAGTATLQATLYIDGAITTSGVTYAWAKDGTPISGETSRALSVTTEMGLGHVYSCTATWS